jgi:predicted nucleic acid-binding protein
VAVSAALFDSCILIDYLKGHASAQAAFAQDPCPNISLISWMEVMAGVPQEHEVTVRRWLQQFTVVSLDDTIARRAVALRRQHRIKLPDAIIVATANVHGWRLVTRDERLTPMLGD